MDTLSGNLFPMAIGPWQCTVLFIILIPLLTYILTSAKSAYALRSTKEEQIPPIFPYWIPFLGNIIAFTRDAPGFAAEIVKRFGYSTPVRVRFGPFKAYYISNAQHFDVLLKGARNLNSTPGLNLVLQTFFGVPKRVANFYAKDNSGISTAPIPGSNVPPHHRINHLRFSAAQKYLYGPNLDGMTTRFVEHLNQQIANLNGDDGITKDDVCWTDHPNLTHFLTKLTFRAATESLCGPYMFELNPTFGEDFWQYINDLPVLYKGLPRWWNPKAHKARERCLTAITRWHHHAWGNVDREKDDDSVAWEPFFGARIMRTRYKYAMEMEATTDESRAAEDLAMIFAANANAVPATIYFILEFIRDPSLLARARADIAAALIPPSYSSSSSPSPSLSSPLNHNHTAPRFNLPCLTSSPILQSVFAETLRLRIAVVLMRSPEKHDFRLDRWLFKRGDLIFLCSATAARNKDLWNEKDVEGRVRGVDEFWAERFLVYPGEKGSGPVKQREVVREKTSANGDDTKALPSPSSSSSSSSSSPTAADRKESNEKDKGQEPHFSLQGLAGGFVPFGGGVRMCPGRFFAKNEMLASLATLVTIYDFELRTPEGWKPEPDMSYYLVGALPPKGEIPFRVRRRRVDKAG